MKIRFLEDYNTDATKYRKGQEYEVPDRKAVMYVGSRVAEKVTEKQAKPHADATK